MACRVGITTRPLLRRLEWFGKHPNMTNWQVSGPYYTRESAQRDEDFLVETLGCEGHHGGDEPDNPDVFWWLYMFNH